MELFLGKHSWSSIVSKNPNQNFYPCTINLGQASSLSSLSHNNYKQRRKKKDKVSEYIETMEKRLNKNSSKKQTNHNKHKVDSIQNNDQSGSKPKRAKSPETNTG